MLSEITLEQIPPVSLSNDLASTISGLIEERLNLRGQSIAEHQVHHMPDGECILPLRLNIRDMQGSKDRQRLREH